jgi:hypothetical protein
VLVDSVDFFRLDANRKIDPERRSELGQFMTPPATAKLMASMFDEKHVEHTDIRLLDPGAGVGSLTAAFVAEMCTLKKVFTGKPVRTVFYMEPGHRKALDAISKKTGAPLAELLRRAVETYKSVSGHYPSRFTVRRSSSK